LTRESPRLRVTTMLCVKMDLVVHESTATNNLPRELNQS